VTKVRFFRTPASFRKWLAKHHATAEELWVGYYKRGSGTPSVTWPETVDEALCFGWIDGIRKSEDDLRYTIRFSPRKPGSTWSAVNIRRARSLQSRGLMGPAGRAAFLARKENKSGAYSYEQRSSTLPEPYASQLKKNSPAWKYFREQSPTYRKAVSWWVVSAKQEDTRKRRLEQLIEDSAAGRPIALYLRSKPKPK
jgi:uncharacterized protein YdeI (YjbR/CyaY-like superfamily)